MDLYAERSMVAYRLRAKRFRSKDESVSMDELDGKSLYQWVEAYRSSAGGTFSSIGRSGRYYMPVDCRVLDEGALVTLASGTAGELREIYDLGTCAKGESLARDEVPTVHTRVFVTTERTPSYGLVFVEHSASAAGDTAFLRGFTSFMGKECRPVTLDWTAVFEPEAIESLRGISKVEFVRTYTSNDVAEGASALAREVRCSVAAKRGRFFPARLLGSAMTAVEGAVAGMQGCLSLFGASLPDWACDEGTRAFADVVRGDGTKRRVEVGLGCDFKMREILNEKGSPELEDNDFVGVCLDKAEVLWDRYGA